MDESVVGENRTLSPNYFIQMTFEEFQHLARLSVVGALDPDEAEQFEAGRRLFGKDAERFLKECQKLNAVFALSLQPCAPDPRTKARLFERIRATLPRPNERPPGGVMPGELKPVRPVAAALRR